jgi:hypothetical protein
VRLSKNILRPVGAFHKFEMHCGLMAKTNRKGENAPESGFEGEPRWSVEPQPAND